MNINDLLRFNDFSKHDEENNDDANHFEDNYFFFDYDYNDKSSSLIQYHILFVKRKSHSSNDLI